MIFYYFCDQKLYFDPPSLIHSIDFRKYVKINRTSVLTSYKIIINLMQITNYHLQFVGAEVFVNVYTGEFQYCAYLGSLKGL